MNLIRLHSHYDVLYVAKYLENVTGCSSWSNSSNESSGLGHKTKNKLLKENNYPAYWIVIN